MNRISRILFGLICLESGVLLVSLPWTHFWDQNFFLDRYPALIPFLLSPYLRGAVTGLGLLDIAIAASALLRRHDADAAI
ncbi:MAG: hypothetical protein GZ088_12245 [Acidipila sp.]|nr:hypothetical protein [Acidipila sp.]